MHDIQSPQIIHEVIKVQVVCISKQCYWCNLLMIMSINTTNITYMFIDIGNIYSIKHKTSSTRVHENPEVPDTRRDQTGIQYR